MYSGSDFELRWPADLLAAELDAIQAQPNRDDDQLRRLLTEAFNGTTATDHLDAITAPSGWLTNPASTTYTVKRFMSDLAGWARAGTLRSVRDIQPLWKQRRGLQPHTAQKHDAVTTRIEFGALVGRMFEQGYFGLDAARPCVDDYSASDSEFDLDNMLVEQVGPLDTSFLRQAYVPVENASDSLPTIAELDDDTFFELIEYLHDLSARPRSAYFHTYADCGWHFSKFARPPGQRLYRWHVNRLLDKSVIPLRLAEQGEFVGRLMETTDDARTELVAQVRQSVAAKDVDTVDHAIALFQRRGATEHDKRSATVVLVGLLENSRDLLKNKLTKKDEGALFHIANQFHIRHQNSTQQDDYDPVFLDWVFWWYLATVELTQRLLDRQEIEPGDPGSTLNDDTGLR